MEMVALRLVKAVFLTVSAGALIISAAPTKAADDVELAQRPPSQSITRDSIWSLRLPKESIVAFKGVVSFDEAGAGNTQILYPAPNAVGFLAAVLTHGAITESQKDSQKNQLQESANKVLTPYETVLNSFTHKDLMQRGLQKVSMGSQKKLIDFSEKTDDGWIVESVPVFLITQDQSSIILENSISIRNPGVQPTPAYQNTIRVVSEAREAKDLVSFWTANQGEKLKEESADLFAQSLNIAIGEISRNSNKDGNPQKTFRYLEGSTEKMERGELISEHCNRIVIKTLRGGLISAPIRREANSNSRC